MSVFTAKFHPMSLQEIESELENLTSAELRHIALTSWRAFMAKENSGAIYECDEVDPSLLSALDESVIQADQKQDGACTAQEVRRRLAEWISK